MLGSVADEQGKGEESLGHLERACRSRRRGCFAADPDSRVLSRSWRECRWSLAQSLSRQGNDEKARSLILANRRMLDDVPEDDRTPLNRDLCTLVRLDLHQFKAGYDPRGLPVG